MGFIAKVGNFLVGGTAKAGLDVAGGVADLVERWKPGDAKNVEFIKELTTLVNTSYDSARKHDTPMQSGVKWVDAGVNSINRLIRPWITITVIGSLFGLGERWSYFNLPAPESIAPEYWVMAKVILGFWFGGRLITKDIPAALGHMLKR